MLIDNSLDREAACFAFEDPCGEIQARDLSEVDAAIDALSLRIREGLYAVGYFAYEMGYALEPRLHPLLDAKQDRPLLRFALFKARHPLTSHEADALLASWTTGNYEVSEPTVSMDNAHYSERFARIRDYIAAGDIYQLNLTLNGHFNLEGCQVALYRDLRRKQPVAYGAFMQFADMTLLSLSPELFLDITNGQALTRPMKGTAARGLTLEEDDSIRRWLANDAKSRAENLMIADLMRNDLSRIARTGSVQVRNLFSVETYRTLHQMTSDVGAELEKDTGLKVILQSLFPPGSITGAPKLRAMEIIHELEESPRGVYTGAIGMLEPNGNAQFNVAIRTLTLDAKGRGEIGIGSGVVDDSTADAEYEECLLKMRFLTQDVDDFDLIETLLYESGAGYVLLGRHLDRLEASAAYFHYPMRREMITQALDTEAGAFAPGMYRVRLLLHADGKITLTSTPVAAPDEGLHMTYTFSPHKTVSDNVFLYHKTTMRALYDNEHARVSAEFGADEVLFINERGELTEGSRTNIFMQFGNVLLTPPLKSGLLPGTLRGDLIERGQVKEAILYLDDIDKAGAIFLGNSVRGLVPATQINLPIRQVAGR